MGTESVNFYQTHAEAWVDQIAKTRDLGRPVRPRSMNTLEREFTQFEVGRPLTFPMSVEGRRFKDVIPAVEALSMIAQTSLPITLTDSVQKFGEFTDDGVLWGSYGARLHGQIGDLVRRIKSDADTRQAVLTIFDGGRDLAASKRDIPCTVALQFLLRRDRLNMRVTMRSNDLWLGTPYDQVQFAILQATIAQAVGVEPGYYVHASGSTHLYERDFEKADAVRNVILGPQKPMAFPLWPDDSLEDITTRAQRILIGEIGTWQPETEFERWCSGLV